MGEKKRPFSFYYYAGRDSNSITSRCYFQEKDVGQYDWCCHFFSHFSKKKINTNIKNK